MTGDSEVRAPAEVGNISIWIIEDNERYRNSLREIIDMQQGWVCPHGFSRCEDALDALRVSYPPEVFLLDIGLPGMSGVEGIEHFKRITPSSHVIILTIHDDSSNVFGAICAGASGYLLKDSSADRVVDGIQEVLAGGAAMNAQIARKVMDFLAQSNTARGEYGLTEREKEILRLVVDGKIKKQIAEMLFLSYHTINTHLKNIYKKLQVTTSAGAVSKVIRENLL